MQNPGIGWSIEIGTDLFKNRNWVISETGFCTHNTLVPSYTPILILTPAHQSSHFT